jgi:hypothetical protein
MVGVLCDIHCAPNTTVNNSEALLVFEEILRPFSHSGGLLACILRTPKYYFRRAWIPLALRVFSKTRW